MDRKGENLESRYPHFSHIGMIASGCSSSSMSAVDHPISRNSTSLFQGFLFSPPHYSIPHPSRSQPNPTYPEHMATKPLPPSLHPKQFNTTSRFSPRPNLRSVSISGYRLPCSGKSGPTHNESDALSPGHATFS